MKTRRIALAPTGLLLMGVVACGGESPESGQVSTGGEERSGLRSEPTEVVQLKIPTIGEPMPSSIETRDFGLVRLGASIDDLLMGAVVLFQEEPGPDAYNINSYDSDGDGVTDFEEHIEFDESVKCLRRSLRRYQSYFIHPERGSYAKVTDRKADDKSGCDGIIDGVEAIQGEFFVRLTDDYGWSFRAPLIEYTIENKGDSSDLFGPFSAVGRRKSFSFDRNRDGRVDRVETGVFVKEEHGQSFDSSHHQGDDDFDGTVDDEWSDTGTPMPTHVPAKQ